MLASEYAEFCQDLSTNDLDFSSPAIIHAVLGIAGEAGELVDVLKKHIVYKTPLDRENLKEELGDLLHYLVRLTSTCGWTIDEIMENNVAKLKKRYPNGYSNEAAVARADKKEQK